MARVIGRQMKAVILSDECELERILEVDENALSKGYAPLCCWCGDAHPLKDCPLLLTDITSRDCER